MLLGLVGKPSSGKSTFFKAATRADVLIASYPFATIKPNHGIGYVRIECIEKMFNTTCNPQKGYCINGNRFVPIELVDVAGLVEGASEGKGMGNQFLDNLTSADALLHIVDASGETDAEGKQGNGNPIADIEMLENELDAWYYGILMKVWRKLAKQIQSTKEDVSKAIAKQFSGLKVTEEDVRHILLQLGYDVENPAQWTENELKVFAHSLRHETKPMVIVANKCDKGHAQENIEEIKKKYPEVMVIPCSADSELALRDADKAGLIEYMPGASEFKTKDTLNEKQQVALASIAKNVLNVYGSTGVQEVLDKTVFELLGYIAIFPASAQKLTDSKGNVLPDCFLLPKQSTALDFAFSIHDDLGKNFIKAIDVKTKRAVGKEHIVKHLDGLEIITR
jgi:ribosome-binding ATPase